MAFTLPPLPYGKEALSPYISAHTLDYHHGKHHQAYVDNLNHAIQETSFASLSLEDVILQSYAAKNEAVFNQGAQVWNHTFYWHSMKPQGGGKPQGILAEKIERDLGGFEGFKSAFKQAALSQFGSGWAWLCEKEGRLSVMKTSNADLPMVHGFRALLTIDVWEHAYYLDCQNRRAHYIDVFLDHLINWDFAAQNLEL